MKENFIKAVVSRMPIENIEPGTVLAIMKSNDFSSSIWEITPAIAKVLLKANTKNRAVRRARVELYKADIINGRWARNGESICFKKNGELADGQHRLMAISEAGVAVNMNVATGCDDDCEHTYDSGLNRTISDNFKYNGIPSYAIVSSVVNKYFLLKRQHPFISTRNQVTGSDMLKYGRITRSVLLEEYAGSASLYQRASKTAGRIYDKSRVLRTSEIGGMIVYLVKDLGYDYDFVKEFFVGLATDGWCYNKVVANLRVKLMRDAISKNTAMSRQYKQALVIKAWNCYAAGINVGRLSYDEKKEGKIWFRPNKSRQAI